MFSPSKKMQTARNYRESRQGKVLSIIIPALNEERGIAKTIQAIPVKEIGQMGYQLQVVVVDNGSQDRTAELAAKAGAEVVPEPRRGYGAAFKRGFASAKGDVIVTMDADATYPMEEIPNLLRVLDDEHLDFITTNRFAALDQGAMSLQNKIGNTILALETKLLFALNMNDPESGMWMFRKSILPNLKLHSNTWPFSHEIKIEACHYGRCCWRELPIRYRARMGQTKLLNGWKVGLDDFLHIAKKRIVR